MTTRDEILAALTEHRDGLTSKELAPLCPACECDEQIVGRVIAGLRAEDVIHPVGLRAGATIYKFGPPPSERVNEQPVTETKLARIAPLPDRFPKAAAGMAPDRAHSPATTPAPAPAAAPHQEQAMATKKPLAERVVEALKKHGACTLEQLAKHAGSTAGSLSTIMGTLKKKYGVIRGKAPGMPSTYSLGAPADALQRGAELGRNKPKRKPQRVNGRAPAPSRAAPSAPPAARAPIDGAAFGINEMGEIGIEKGGVKVRLDVAEFARLREFIERTTPVWQGGK